MSPKNRRRGPGEGNIEKVTLKSGKTAYRGWITVGYKVGEDGKKRAVRRSVQHRRHDAVVEGLAKLREKYRADLDLKAEVEMRLSTLFDKWLEHFIATTPHKKRTPVTYRWAIEHAKTQLGDPLVARVLPRQLQEVLNTLGQKYAGTSLNLVRVVLDGAFGQAVLWRIRPDNPAANLKLPRERADATPAPRRVLTADEGRSFVDALQAERLGLGAALTYAVGMRPGEAVALRVQDFDLERCTVTIAGTHTTIEGKVEREAPKSRRGERTVPFAPELAPWVRQRIARVQNERVVMREQWTAPDEGLLFVRETDGGRLSNYHLYRVARRVAEQVGLGKVGPRVLRRSLLSQLAKQGVESKVRAAIGGHTTEITEKHYREVDPTEMSAAMGRVSSLLPDLDMAADEETDADAR